MDPLIDWLIDYFVKHSSLPYSGMLATSDYQLIRLRTKPD